MWGRQRLHHRQQQRHAITITITITITSIDGDGDDGNLAPQSPSAIEGYINGVFGFSLGAAVSYCNSATSGCTAGTTAGLAGGVNSCTRAAACDYLAIHFGHSDLAFHWTAPVAAGTTFTVAGLPKDLRNYRAHVSAAPEPETHAMLLAGLGMLGWLARRRAS